MKSGLLSLGLFGIAQLMLWYVSAKDNIASGNEIMFATLVIGVFLLIFVAGYHWAKWIATILLSLLALLVGSMTFEGFGVGFLSVAFLYVAVILSMFNHGKKITPKPYGETDVIDADLNHDVIIAPVVYDGFSAGDKTYRYPILVKRLQSVLIDSVILFTIMVVVLVIIGESSTRQTIMVSLGIIFFLVYEPLLTSYSATIGQRLVGIRVRDMQDPEKRINIFQAYMRLLVKFLLGWLSFITIHFNPAHRAIHDFASSSVVIKVK